MGRRSAGILLYRRGNDGLEVLLVHPGGPFWQGRDRGAWSIPKGEFGQDEEPVAVARREFEEELGPVPEGPLLPLGEIQQKGRKTVLAFALEGIFEPAALVSNMFEIEWPPRSGRRQQFPEIDKAEWFGLATAEEKINEGQKPFLRRLEQTCGSRLRA